MLGSLVESTTVRPYIPLTFTGLDFFITEIPREVFTYSETDSINFALPSNDIYPYLLVNIGSGVSMIKVSAKKQKCNFRLDGDQGQIIFQSKKLCISLSAYPVCSVSPTVLTPPQSQ